MANIKCGNAECPEVGFVKDPGTYDPAVIVCGECGQPMQTTEDELTPVEAQLAQAEQRRKT